MRQILVALRLTVLFSAILFSKSAVAGCYCKCVDGEFQPICSNPFDIPPICSMRTCPFTPGIVPLPLGSSKSCWDEKKCDAYGVCDWQRVCK